MTREGEGVFNLAGVGDDGLRVMLGQPPAPKAADPDARTWLTGYIAVRAHPFAGTIEAVLTPADVTEWERAAAALADSGSVTVGGGRGAEVRLVRDGQVTEVCVTPSGDDPWPLLRYLVFHDEEKVPSGGDSTGG